MRRLIEGGALRVYAEHKGIGHMTVPGMPPNHYRISTFEVGHKKENVSEWLQALAFPGTPYREAKRIRSLVGTNLTPSSDDYGLPAISALCDDLKKVRMTTEAFARSAKVLCNKDIDPLQLQYTINHLGNSDYVVDTNLSGLLAETRADVLRNITANALMGLVGLNHKLEAMKVFDATTALTADDTSLLEAKVLGLVGLADAADKHKQLSRVLNAAGLPDFEYAVSRGAVDFDTLLDVRSSDEAKAFRDWLPRAGESSDEELAKLLRGIGARIIASAESPTGTLLRILSGAGLGALVTGPLAVPVGVGISALDSFLMEYVVPKAGPWSFVDNRLTTVFKQPSPSAIRR